MEKKINIALIGLGYWGPNHLRTFCGLKNVKVKKVCDILPDKWDKISADYPSVEYVNDIGKVFDDESINAVVVVTGAEAHFDIAKQCLVKGKHVFVEKPLALSSAEAQELTDIAQKNKLILMVGHLLEYHPAVQKLKSLIEHKELGDIKYGYSVRVNLGKARSKENVLWSLAPHDISVLLYLFGEEPEIITAEGASYLREGIADVVFATLRFKNGMIANMHLSWLDPHKMRRLTIVGDKKMCVFDDMAKEGKLKIYHNESIKQEKFDFYDEEYVKLKAGEVTCPEIDIKPPLQIECEHFVDCVLSGKTPLSDGNDGVRVLKVLEKIQKELDTS